MTFYEVLEPVFTDELRRDLRHLPNMILNEIRYDKISVAGWVNRNHIKFDNYNECLRYAGQSDGPYRIVAYRTGEIVYEQPTRLQKALGE